MTCFMKKNMACFVPFKMADVMSVRRMNQK